ncbi:MAG: sugar phosphate nucleotidyltransferase [Candidatus Pacebacteria bacterium]|nr:sugar phosphate nucleotidyltransferase [Candidatus Paceibacterota bacterium]
MKAIVIAAGVGKRMQPLTFTTPKPLLTVLGKSLLEHVFDALPDEITEIIVVIGYKGEMIKEKFGDSYKGKKLFYIEQKEQLGTAHALELCRHLLTKGERFLVMYADDIHDKKSIQKMLVYSRCLLLSRAEHPERFGIVEIDKDNKIIDLVEKPENPKTNLASNGVYLLDDHVFHYKAHEHKGEFFLSVMIEKMLKDFPTYGVISDLWIPIGYPEDLKKAEEILTARK